MRRSPNFMVKSVRNESGRRSVAKLIDLERSIAAAGRSADTYVACPNWLAPEVIQTRMPSQQADVYALAIVVWEVLVGQAPFAQLHESRAELSSLIVQGLRPSITGAVPQSIAFVMFGIWTSLPSERPSASMLQETIEDVQNELHRPRPGQRFDNVVDSF